MPVIQWVTPRKITGSPFGPLAGAYPLWVPSETVVGSLSYANPTKPQWLESVNTLSAVADNLSPTALTTRVRGHNSYCIGA